MTPAERLFASFERLYVINLPDRIDRRGEMAGELKRIGTGFGDPRVSLLQAERPAEAAGFPSIGARGCFLSHLAVLRDARGAGHARILILEDDCDFVAAVKTLLPPLLDDMDQLSLDILFGGGVLPEGSRAAAMDRRPLVLLDHRSPVRTTHCVGFGAAAIAALVPHLEAMAGRPAGSTEGGPMHVDGAYTWFRRARPDLRAGLANPVIALQRPSRSDIAGPGLLDRLPASIRGIARRWRREANRHAR